MSLTSFTSPRLFQVCSRPDSNIDAVGFGCVMASMFGRRPRGSVLRSSRNEALTELDMIAEIKADVS